MKNSTLIALVFLCFLLSSIASAKVPDIPIILEDRWERAPFKLEEEQEFWFMGRHKKSNDKESAFIKCIVPFSSEDVTKKKEAIKSVIDLVKTVSEQEKPKYNWREGKNWATARYTEKADEEGNEIYRHLIAIWDGKKIRAIFFIVPAELGKNLPYFCFRLIVKWLNPGFPPSVDNCMIAATSFQQAVQGDFDSLFSRYITKQAHNKLNSLNDSLIYTPFVKGWRYLISHSTVTYSSSMGNKQIITYYHPYSDIIVLTTWQKFKQSEVLMTDAVMIDGHYLRNKDKVVPSTIPTWLSYKKNFPVINIGKITNKVIYEARKQGDVLCQYLDNSRRTRKNRNIICSSYFLSHLHNISSFYKDETVKNKTYNFLMKLHKKEPSIFANAKDMEQDSAMKGLYSLSAGYIETLSPKAYFKSQDLNTLLLASPRSTGSFIMLSFDNSDNPHPVRKGVINIQDMINKFKKKA